MRFFIPISMQTLNTNINANLILTGGHAEVMMDSIFSSLILRGGDGRLGDGARINLAGSNEAPVPSAALIYVPNAALNDDVEVVRFVGGIDPPYLDMLSHQVKNLLDPVALQDAATKNFVENHHDAAANLTDYATGVFTPIIDFGGLSVGITYSAQAGCYTRIGNIVTVSGFIVLTNKGTSAGIAYIGNLPFTVSNQNGAYSPAVLQIRSITFADQYSGTAMIDTNTIRMGETSNAGAYTDITDVDFSNTSTITFSCTYRVA